ncbi:MAG TPA: YbhB/YbcL family Raf kinase inhibitor-like protein, partial [Candidatus Binatia bacterium]|nr:YbhB/YbcL family Raf kinase inhibitor-like protein [Candidatus Binatia bacterium]
MSGQIKLIFAATLLAGFLTACGADNTKPSGVAMSIQLTSTAFTDGRSIPAKYTCDGADISPALTWTNTPSGTKSFALIADDPDAPVGTWVHWLIYDLPAGTNSL